MESLFSEPTSWLGFLGSAALLLAAGVTKKYVIPFLRVGKRQKYARYIAMIADELTDDLRNTYPDKEWVQHLDEVVDRLAAICGVSPEIARRAINASVGRNRLK